jgi:hypothetical protein
MKEARLKVKDGIKAIVFDPKDPPECAMKVTRSMDDASGVFDYKEWMVGNKAVKEGDLILYASFGINGRAAIVIPKYTIGILVEVVE